MPAPDPAPRIPDRALGRVPRTGLVVAALLVIGPWFGALTHPDESSIRFAIGVTAFVLPFVAILAWVARRRARAVPDRRPDRPENWRPAAPPPHPAIGPAAWAWARFDLDPDAPYDAGSFVVDPVTAARRDAAPIAEGLPLPALLPADVADHQRTLDAMPEVCAVWFPLRWPVCCDRLAVVWLVQPLRGELSALEAASGPVDGCDPSPAWALELAEIRAGRAPVEGVNLFVCSACFRVYGAFAQVGEPDDGG